MNLSCSWAGKAVYGPMLVGFLVLSVILYRSKYNDLEMLHRFDKDSSGSRTLKLSKFKDPSTVIYKENNGNLERSGESLAQRARCQIIFVLGVEGTMHHGISPVLVELANQQRDPITGVSYHAQFESRYLRYGIFGWPSWVRREFGLKRNLSINDPKLVQKVISAICPNNGQHHIIIEGVSFPAGDETSNTHLPVKRQRGWQKMTPEQISISESALNHPINLEKFYNAYHPYADIKFIVLHRPYLETIASHPDLDAGPISHSNIIQGFLIILSKFLESHKHDAISGEKVWWILHTEKLAVQYYGPRDKRENWLTAFTARREIARKMAIFLGWPQTECQHCFVTWKDSTNDYRNVFSDEEISLLREHAAKVERIWPPSANKEELGHIL